MPMVRRAAVPAAAAAAAALLAASTAWSSASAYSFTASPPSSPSSRWGAGADSGSGRRLRRVPSLAMKDPDPPSSSKSGGGGGGGGGFSLSSIFGRGSSPPPSSSAAKSSASSSPPATAEVGSPSPPPHPSLRDHVSPLGLLHPSRAREASKLPDPLPVHPDVRSGVLPNGLSYAVLPNRSPPGRFEAHLQVFSGSADEQEPQQGIAHLTEHVAYMGSRKRERLFGTGSQTNAYTDFHHTVFYAACPVTTPRGGAPMLPMALDALCDVMEARVEKGRLEKERAAVLSEMTMVNTIEYRVECQILGTLHRENRLAKRFPIGKEVLIRSWTTDDVRAWHRTHYRPDNVLLYIVGDIDPAEAEEVVADKFGRISAERQASQIKIPEIAAEASRLADAVMAGTVKQGQSWHYPPVRHDWCVPRGTDISSLIHLPEDARLEYDVHLQDDYPLDEPSSALPTVEVAPGKLVRPHIFRHELLQAFSLHLFAKRPVEPVITLPSLRRSLARRIALAALQIRLNVGGRSDDPPFTFVEFNQLDSAREGCAVCSLDLTAEPSRWRDAVLKSLGEVRRLGVHGVTAGEMERYAGSLMTDAQQLAAQGDGIGHGDQLAYLMETVANGHAFMSPEQSYEMTAEALSTLTLEEVNDAAAELCSHVTGLHPDSEGADGVCVAVACTPRTDDASGPEHCDESSLLGTILEACAAEVGPEEDVAVPRTLVPDLDDAVAANPPEWRAGTFTDGTPDTPPDKLTRPFTLRRLGNGVRVGVSHNPAESQRGHLRLVAPGGRDAERRLGFRDGSMAVGARAMQEGGAFGEWSREQVELFCVDHLIMVEINCNEESLVLDFVFPTTNVGNTGFGDDVRLGITGTEAVMQIVREILIGFKWEEDALGRSKQSFRSAHESLQKNLEGKTTEMIMEAMTNHDSRFLSIDVDTVDAVTLDDARDAVMSQLLPPDLEISAAGDFDVSEVLDLILRYVGTVPADANSEYRRDVPAAADDDDDGGSALASGFGSVPPLSLPGEHLELELSDSDPRAVSYVAGAAPNLWGYLADGTSVADRIGEADAKATEYDRQRRAHPLFANVALALVAEIANRRLFSTVRERRQLTYDANFSFTGFERLMGGWFLITVTASKEKAQAALDACKETIDALRRTNPITPDNLESAKRVVLNRHEGELRTSGYWAMMMSGLQQESIPLKGPLSVTDFHAMVEAVTTKDLQLTLECLGLDEDELYTAIGRTVRPGGYVPEDEVVKASPMAGMSRGGALMMMMREEEEGGGAEGGPGRHILGQ